MTAESPKPAPFTTGMRPESASTRIPTSASVVRVESFFPVPVTVRLEVRDFNAADALNRLDELYSEASAQLCALAKLDTARKVASL